MEGLGWYEVGQVINDGTDFVYIGNKDIWPGEHADLNFSLHTQALPLKHLPYYSAWEQSF